MTRRALVVVAALGVWAALIGSASAQATVTIDRSSVRLGDRITVRMQGWPVRHPVNVSVCGNAAARGSVDCNLTDTSGYGISEFETEHLTEFVVKAPPAPCPCVIRVSNASQSLVAVTNINIVNMASAPVLGATVSSPFAVSVRVRRASGGLLGWVRSSLGGSTAYDVTVVARNRSAAVLDGVQFRGRAGRNTGDQARVIAIPAAPALMSGQEWSHTERVRLAAPVVGAFHWSVAAFGAGASERAATRTDNRPLALYVLALLLVGDLVWLTRRRLLAAR